MLSAAMEDYIKTIYHLRERTGERVQTSEIAAELEVTAPTVTSMLEKLKEKDLIEHQKYSGAALTKHGERVALEVIRHHRLLEAYLTEHLDYSWTEVHEEADRLEHHISEKFEQRVAAELDDPDTDPHGDPIPTATLDLPEAEAALVLAEREEGTTVVVEQVENQDVAVLEYLSERGITPGTEVTVREVAPFGMVTVSVGDAADRVSLPQDIANGVRVTPVEAG